MVRHQPGKWEVVEVDVEEPRQDELLVRLVAAGLCHSDDHVTSGDLPVERFRWRAAMRAPASSSR